MTNGWILPKVHTYYWNFLKMKACKIPESLLSNDLVLVLHRHTYQHVEYCKVSGAQSLVGV